MATSDLIDLRPDQLAIVEGILVKHVPDCEVWAFGSRATWTAKDYSDLDLAVVGDGPLGWKRLGRLKEAFEESTLPMRVDVLDWHRITDSFRETIESDCIVIQDVGDLKSWPTVALGDVATVVMGQSPPGSTYNDVGDGLPFYQGARDFGERHPIRRMYCTAPTRRAIPRDILLTVRAPVGRINRAVQECAIGRGVAAIRSDPQGATDYLDYALKTLAHQWHGLEATGTVFGSARKSDLLGLEIPWPPADDRRAIVGVLGALDDKIELNRRISDTLEDLARALFRSWFVDFDPVHAKAEGRPSGLPSDLDQLFPDSFEPSELGDIPAGWQAARLGTIVEQHRHSENPFDSPSTLFDHYSIPAYDAAQTPKEESGENIKSAKFRVLPGTILLSRLNPEIERVWLSDVAPGDRAVCSTEFMVLEPRQPIDRNYTYCLTRSPSFRCQIESLVTGTSKSHQRARPEAVLSLPVLVPPAPVVRGFGEQVSPALTRTLHCRKAMKTLAALRDTLLPRLLSGELRVRVAERSPAPTPA